MTWTATITRQEYDRLHAHLFRPDGDEHAAFLFAGYMATRSGPRLLIRQLVPVADADFGPSDRGAYRQISARAVTRAAVACDSEGLCLLWAHSHPGSGIRAGFSPDDLDSHARAHPHLINMIHGRSVGSLIFGEDSVAGELWSLDQPVNHLSFLRIVGPQLRDLRPSPRPRPGSSPARFARQELLFGKEGQAILRGMTVGIAGAGGGGSLIVQTLAHLGVGRIILVDFDVISESNLSRVVGSTPAAAPRKRRKVHVLRDLVRRIDPSIEFEAVVGDITYADDARLLAEADFLFSATDTIFARYAFNALVYQYMIPGIQVGAKIHPDSATGDIDLVYAAERPVTLDSPCLECAGLIPADALHKEQLSPEERRAQRYLDHDDEDAGLLDDPSVITLNSVATSLATTDFMFMATGLLPAGTDLAQRIYYPQERDLRGRGATARLGCRWCDRSASVSVFGRGDLWPLPLRLGHLPKPQVRRH